MLASTEDGGQGFLNFIKNSMFVAIGTVVLSLLVAVPGAYAVSRLEFFGRRQISAVFLGVYFFPAILLAIPLFVFFTRIGQRGTLTGLLVVYVAQVAAVSIYMLRNYFDTIPASIEEAAAIDGCTRLQAMRHVSLPLALPAIASNALFVFMIAWNEFLFALLFLVEKRENWTVSLGLSQLAGSIEVPTTVLMAGSVILTVPIIVLVLPQRALAGRWPDRGRREGLSPRARGRLVHRPWPGGARLVRRSSRSPRAACGCARGTPASPPAPSSRRTAAPTPTSPARGTPTAGSSSRARRPSAIPSRAGATPRWARSSRSPTA